MSEHSRRLKTEESDPSPPHAVGKRETLTSRAKRIIGRELEENPEDSPPAESSCASPSLPRKMIRKHFVILANTDSIENWNQEITHEATRAGSSSSAVISNQFYPVWAVLMSSNSTHRQRTQGYIRELEKEVLRLRETEGQLSVENQNLKAKVDVCVHTLHSNGIPVPEVSVSASPSYFRTTSSNLGSQQDLLSNSGYALSGGMSSAADSVSIDLRDLETLEPEYPCSRTAGLADPRQFELPEDQNAFMNFPYRERSHSDNQQGSATHLGAQAGIDFILE
jgi:hypothetical protein